MDVDGSNLTNLTPSPDAYANRHPTWLGTSRIVFSADRGNGEQIQRMDSDGTDIVELTTESEFTFNQFPDGSVDGELVTWQRIAGDESDFEIWTLEADGTDKQQVTVNSLEDNTPGYHGTTSKITFSRNPNRTEIWKMDADGSDEAQITNPGSFGDRSPDWRGPTLP